MRFFQLTILAAFTATSTASAAFTSEACTPPDYLEFCSFSASSSIGPISLLTQAPDSAHCQRAYNAEIPAFAPGLTITTVDRGSDAIKIQPGKCQNLRRGFMGDKIWFARGGANTAGMECELYSGENCGGNMEVSRPPMGWQDRRITTRREMGGKGSFKCYCTS